MGKAGSLTLAAVLIAAAALAPGTQTSSRAQSTPVLSCTSHEVTSPMQGHYVGPWHSNGDYHFLAHFPAFNGFPASDKDIEMKIIVDGTLDLTVHADGTMSGTASGSVDAPIFHDGAQDISSGIGTISGQITGVFSGSSSILILAHPVIDMHWGTFGGRAVETFPVMPDYRFVAGGLDCISSQGSSAEQGFPVMNITNDNTGQLTQAPGIGTATGSWQVTSDKAAQYSSLSQQVDIFISKSNGLLQDNTTPLNPSQILHSIVEPMTALVNAILQDPDISRCLLERLGVWEASVVPALFQRAQELASAADLASLRRAGDVLRSAQSLNLHCGVSDNGASATVLDAERRLLDTSVPSRDWKVMALVVREMLLLQGPNIQSSLHDEIARDIHASLQATTAGPALLDLARVAYAAGDTQDATAAVAKITPTGHTASRLLDSKPPWVPVKKRKKRRHPTPTPTPTPKPAAPLKTLPQILASGIASIRAQHAGSSPPTFSWQPVAGAAQYAVFVTAAQGQIPIWFWSGTGTSVVYGDTALQSTPGTDGDAWPESLSATAYTWSVIALDSHGAIVGAALRKSA